MLVYIMQIPISTPIDRIGKPFPGNKGLHFSQTPLHDVCAHEGLRTANPDTDFFSFSVKPAHLINQQECIDSLTDTEVTIMKKTCRELTVFQ